MTPTKREFFEFGLKTVDDLWEVTSTWERFVKLENRDDLIIYGVWDSYTNAGLFQKTPDDFKVIGGTPDVLAEMREKGMM